jgi:hypothetical protein
LLPSSSPITCRNVIPTTSQQINMKAGLSCNAKKFHIDESRFRSKICRNWKL